MSTKRARQIIDKSTRRLSDIGASLKGLAKAYIGVVHLFDVFRVEEQQAEMHVRI